MSDFKNGVKKIMSKSPSRHLVMLQGKLKLTEKAKQYLHICKFYLYSSIFQCASHQLISVAALG
jgi:hypothetical protein